MNIEQFADPYVCCRIISVLYGLSIAITCGEKLLYARDYTANGWLPWKIFRFDRIHMTVVRRYPRLMDALFGRSGMSVALAMGIGGSALMWASQPTTWSFTCGVALTGLVCFFTNVRCLYGGDGSQQMNLIIGVALLLGFNPWVRPAVGTVCLLFIAAQSGLAYFTSGVSKLVSPIWMRGDPLVGILATRAYGSGFGLRTVLRLGRFRRVLAIVMVLLETLFPLCVILPRQGLYAMLLWGVAFHVTNAFIMGLNTFFWSFIATYPALCYAWFAVH